MRRIMGILLILVAIALGYFGFTNYRGSGTAVHIETPEGKTIDNSTSREKAYILLGGSLLALLLGVYLVSIGKSETVE